MIYQHYKGGLYEVLAINAVDVTNSADEELSYVVYRPIHDEHQVFVRDAEEFYGDVDVSDDNMDTSMRVPRFRRILSAIDIQTQL
jgi:hypothetical protein